MPKKFQKILSGLNYKSIFIWLYTVFMNSSLSISAISKEDTIHESDQEVRI